MADTTFVAGTVIAKEWLNDVNDLRYDTDGVKYTKYLNTNTGGVSRTASSKLLEFASVKDFGAVGDGVTNDTTAIQNALNVAKKVYFPAGTYIHTAELTVPSFTTVYGDGAGVSILQTATSSISQLGATSGTNIIVRDMKFKQTTTAGTAYIAGVRFTSCTLCEVSNNEFEGMQWAGVYLDSSNECKILNNYIYSAQSSAVGDPADITVYRNSSYNLVQGNRCYGGTNSYHGIFIQDPGGAGTFLPQHNLIAENIIKAHSAYGIAVYIGGSQVSYNKIIGNDIEGITGSANAGATGSGIYGVGFGLGGLLISNNTVRNCCVSTTSASNAPGGITVTGTAGGDIRVVVSDNIIDACAQGSGISITSCSGGAQVTGNTVRMPSTNNGAGAGGGALLGQGIKLNDSADVVVSDNGVLNNGTSDGIQVLATSNSFTRVVTNNNVIRAVAGYGIRYDRSSTNTMGDVSVCGNNIRVDGSSAAIAMIGITRGSVSGNSGTSNTGPAIDLNAVVGLRLANNSINSNAAAGFVTAGTCTGSYYDKSNLIPGNITNAATGLRTEWFATAAPAAGTGAVGDRAEQGTPVVGQPKGWRCTVAGAPGTWVSEGNL